MKIAYIRVSTQEQNTIRQEVMMQGNSIYFTDETSPQKRYNVNRVMRDENRKIKRKYKRSNRPEKDMGKFAS
jgi:DNA invertase Pin-like site-specific DNA recombinase